MAKFLYKSLVKLAQMRLIVVVVKVNMYDHSILVQIPGDYNRFKYGTIKRRRKMETMILIISMTSLDWFV